MLLRRPYCYRTMATNNALLNASRCIPLEEPFAPALSRLGGEDVLLSITFIFWVRKSSGAARPLSGSRFRPNASASAISSGRDIAMAKSRRSPV